MSQVENFFDKIAPKYDQYKKNNEYYYSYIKSIYTQLIPQNAKVLEIGCGTGEIISFIDPNYGVGIDISSKMIEIAKNKFKEKNNLSFYKQTIDEFEKKETFNYIFMSDVIEHLENVEECLSFLPQFSQRGTVFINNMANPIWNPFLVILEKLKLKMPEGPINRISQNKLNDILNKNRFRLAKEFSVCILPKDSPFSDSINIHYQKIKPLKNLGLIQFGIYIYDGY